MKIEGDPIQPLARVIRDLHHQSNLIDVDLSQIFEGVRTLAEMRESLLKVGMNEEQVDALLVRADALESSSIFEYYDN